MHPARASRMIGEGKFEERIEVLFQLALDNKQSPFTRRDALKGLRLLESQNPKTMDILLKALDDSYFESKVQALWAMHRLLYLHPDAFEDKDNIRRKIEPLLRSPTFDVRMNALKVLTEICTTFDDVADLFRQNYFHPNWKVRKNIVECFERLFDKDILTQKDISEELKNLLQTSNGFQMHFKLKDQIRSTMQKDGQQQLIKNLSQVLERLPPESHQRLQQLKDFSKETHLHMNVTDVLERLVQEGGK